MSAERSRSRRPLRRTLVLVLVGVAAYYLLAPVTVRLGTRQPPELTVEEAPADLLETLGPEAQAFTTESERALRDDGFTAAARVKATNLTPAGHSVLVLVVNRTAGVAGLVGFVVTAVQGSPSTTQKWVSFSTHIADGTIFETSNVEEVPFLRPRERQHPMSFPEVRDARALYRIHQARVARVNNREFVLPPEGEEVAFMVREFAADLQRQIEVGYMERDPEGGMLRPTWKGAFVMTLKLLPPGRWLAQWSRQRRNAGLLAELGLSPGH